MALSLLLRRRQAAEESAAADILQVVEMMGRISLPAGSAFFIVLTSPSLAGSAKGRA